MLTQYNLKMPHAVYGGENAMDNITAIIKARGAKKVAMFTDKGIPASRDTAPQALVERLDLAQIKQDHALLNASLNGPKLWQPDWVEVDVGTERSFADMPMTWVAQPSRRQSSAPASGPSWWRKCCSATA